MQTPVGELLDQRPWTGPFLDVVEAPMAAEFLEVSPRTIRRWIHRRKLRGYRVGLPHSRLRVRYEDVAALARERERAAVAKARLAASGTKGLTAGQSWGSRASRPLRLSPRWPKWQEHGYNATDVARFLGLSGRTVRRWVHGRWLKGRRTGGKGSHLRVPFWAVIEMFYSEPKGGRMARLVRGIANPGVRQRVHRRRQAS